MTSIAPSRAVRHTHRSRAHGSQLCRLRRQAAENSTEHSTVNRRSTALRSAERHRQAQKGHHATDLPPAESQKTKQGNRARFAREGTELETKLARCARNVAISELLAKKKRKENHGIAGARHPCIEHTHWLVDVHFCC